MQVNIFCCTLVLQTDCSDTGWDTVSVQRGEGSGEPPQLPLLEETSPWCRNCLRGNGLSSRLQGRAAEPNRLQPPTHLPQCPVLWRGRQMMLSTQLCDRALGNGEEPFLSARFWRVCLPWCPTPASSVLRGRNVIF